jgi:hypothetical protein
MKPIEECIPPDHPQVCVIVKTPEDSFSFGDVVLCRRFKFFFKSLQKIKESKEIYEIVFKDRPGKDVIFVFMESLEASDVQEDPNFPLPSLSSPAPSQEGMSSLQVFRMLDRLDDIAEQGKDVLSSLQTTRRELLEKLPALVVQEFIKQQVVQQPSQEKFFLTELEKRASLNGQSLQEYVLNILHRIQQKQTMLDPNTDKELILFFGILKAWMHKISSK